MMILKGWNELIDAPPFVGTSYMLLLLLCLLSSGLLYAENAVAPRNDLTDADIKITQQLAETCQQADQNLAPTMVAIRPGRFQMGSPETEAGRDANESPQHMVTIPRPFALSRCEVTVGQFKQFIQDTGYQTTAETNDKGCFIWNTEIRQAEQQLEYNWKNPGFTQTDQHPVVCVSWQDAQRYVDWLSQRTGAAYRLPTETEWEYAARAGTQTPRYFNDQKQCNYANGLGRETEAIAGRNWVLADCEDGYVYTAPVASFAENYFGLFDMLGNVWEWTQDCWHENYQNAPKDGSGWLEADGGDCNRRVVRGGSWNGDPRVLRSAFRDSVDSDGAGNGLGFRVARAL